MLRPLLHLHERNSWPLAFERLLNAWHSKSWMSWTVASYKDVSLATSITSLGKYLVKIQCSTPILQINNYTLHCLRYFDDQFRHNPPQQVNLRFVFLVRYFAQICWPDCTRFLVRMIGVATLVLPWLSSGQFLLYYHDIYKASNILCLCDVLIS